MRERFSSDTRSKKVACCLSNEIPETIRLRFNSGRRVIPDNVGVGISPMGWAWMRVFDQDIPEPIWFGSGKEKPAEVCKRLDKPLTNSYLMPTSSELR
jgi:hypothetical protein